MRIGVLALQGAFLEQEKMLVLLGAECVELRQRADLSDDLDGIVLPGGESTVQGKLLRSLDMLSPLRAMIQNGIPVFATCAGMILLAEAIENKEEPHLATMPIEVKRNAYGRQLGSFYTEENCSHFGKIPMTFIRAPYVSQVGEGVRILATVKDKVVGVQYQNQIALAFHPELNENTSLHSYFLDLVKKKKLCS